MKKVYKANTHIAISISLPGGKGMHVPFTPLSDGSSTYITDDADIQAGLEKHYKYGRLFRCEGEVKEQPKVEEPKEEKKEPLAIEVSDWGEAKDYLADKYGVSRTLMKSQKSIVENGKAHNVAFKIKE